MDTETPDGFLHLSTEYAFTPTIFEINRVREHPVQTAETEKILESCDYFF